MKRTIEEPAAPPVVSVDAIAASGRPAVEAAIEQLIARLDELDGDPDREPDNEDACDAEDFSRAPGFAVLNIGDADDAEQNGDDEPSLGSLHDHWANQSRWGVGATSDLEQDFDDFEPDVDDEADHEGSPDYDTGPDAEAARKRLGLPTAPQPPGPLVLLDPQGRPGVWLPVPQTKGGQSNGD